MFSIFSSNLQMMQRKNYEPIRLKIVLRLVMLKLQTFVLKIQSKTPFSLSTD